MSAHRYTLTVPVYDNNGASLLTLHDEVRARLAGAFGAYTEHRAYGAWPSEHPGHEPNRVYTVDVQERGDAIVSTALYGLAQYVARDARQDAVYLTRQLIETWLVTAPDSPPVPSPNPYWGPGGTFGN